MAITTFRLDRTTHNTYNERFDQDPEPTFVGCVLRVWSYTVHVHSDSAMLDSGDRTDAEVWDRGRVRTLRLSGGYACMEYKRGEEDATPEVRAMAVEYGVFVGWLRALLKAGSDHEQAVRESRQIRKGCRVEVVKGRKVKKGTQWWVFKVGESGYGPYADLCVNRNGVGEYVRYVSQENLRVIDNEVPALVYPPSPYGPVNATVLSLSLALAKVVIHGSYAGPDAEWQVLHDAWLDSGLPVPEALRRAAYQCD